MSRPSTREARTGQANAASPDSDTRLWGRRLVVARSLIFTTIGFILGLYLLALPGLFPRLAIPCAQALDDCHIFPEQVAPLAGLGISPSGLAGATIALSYATILLVSGVAAVLIWRRSDDWMALFLALTLILMPANFAPVLQGLPDALQGLGQFASNASFFTLYLLIGLFPSGQFVSRWLWLPILVLTVDASFTLPIANDLLGSLVQLVTLGLGICLIGSQVYRYRRIATPLQRQQIKWGVYGLVLTILVNQLYWQPVIWIPALQRHDSLYLLLAGPDSFLMICILAIFFGVAILRYRLYDIDILINRALVYGSLTAILALVYIVSVIGSQTIVGDLTHASDQEQSPLIIVVTTLVIAALFQPLRRRLQTGIDRRFYRHKYDAARTLATFGKTLREEVAPDDLADRLLVVVEETMQPKHVSLWFRHAPGRQGTDGRA